MTIQEFRDYMASGKPVIGGSDVHMMFHQLSQEALKITAEINGCYHTPEELLGHIDDIHLEVITLQQILHQVAPTGNNHAVARLEAEHLAITFKRAIPFMTIGMAQIVGKGSLADSH